MYRIVGIGVDLSSSVNPVSYTHLDVYKRQIYAEAVLAQKTRVKNEDGQYQMCIRDRFKRTAKSFTLQNRSRHSHYVSENRTCENSYDSRQSAPS